MLREAAVLVGGVHRSRFGVAAGAAQGGRQRVARVAAAQRELHCAQRVRAKERGELQVDGLQREPDVTGPLLHRRRRGLLRVLLRLRLRLRLRLLIAQGGVASARRGSRRCACDGRRRLRLRLRRVRPRRHCRLSIVAARHELPALAGGGRLGGLLRRRPPRRRLHRQPLHGGLQRVRVRRVAPVLLGGAAVVLCWPVAQPAARHGAQRERRPLRARPAQPHGPQRRRRRGVAAGVHGAAPAGGGAALARAHARRISKDPHATRGEFDAARARVEDARAAGLPARGWRAAWGEGTSSV